MVIYLHRKLSKQGVSTSVVPSSNGGLLGLCPATIQQRPSTGSLPIFLVSLASPSQRSTVNMTHGPKPTLPSALSHTISCHLETNHKLTRNNYHYRQQLVTIYFKGQENINHLLEGVPFDPNLYVQ